MGNTVSSNLPRTRTVGAVVLVGIFWWWKSGKYQRDLDDRRRQIDELQRRNMHLGQENMHLGQENTHLGQENMHLGQENTHLGQENTHLGQEVAAQEEDCDIALAVKTDKDLDRLMNSCGGWENLRRYRRHLPGLLSRIQRLKEARNAVVHGPSNMLDQSMTRRAFIALSDKVLRDLRDYVSFLEQQKAGYPHAPGCLFWRPSPEWLLLANEVALIGSICNYISCGLDYAYRRPSTVRLNQMAADDT